MAEKKISRAKYVADILIMAKDVEESTRYSVFCAKYGTPSRQQLLECCIAEYENSSMKEINLDEVHPYAIPVIRRLKGVMRNGS